jgi:hypothetical protein
MLTEDEVRDLLRRAGETVEIDPTAPIAFDSPARRRWIAAGAVVAVAAALTLVFSLAGGDGPDSSPGPSGTPDQVRLDVDQVPSVFGMPAEVAVATLQDHGLTVSTVLQDTCQEVDGRALRTDPATGTRFTSGAAVTLYAAREPANARCAHEDRTLAWQLLDFANGWGPAPAFAESLDLYVDGAGPVTVTPGQAADPGVWGEPSALTELEKATGWLRETARDQGLYYDTPVLAVRYDRFDPESSTGSGCGGTPLADLTTAPTFSLEIDIPTDGIFHCPLRIDVYSEDTGIATLATYTEKPLFGTESPAATIVVPPVVGQPYAVATQNIEDAGLTVRWRDVGSCEAPGLVIGQAPLGGAAASPGSVVTLDRPTTPSAIDCTERPSELLEETARTFAVFAGGDDVAPPLADEVDLYLGNQLQKTITAGQGLRRDSWQVCTEYAGLSCPFSALSSLADAGRLKYTTMPGAFCLTSLAELPAELTTPEAQRSSVVVRPRQVATCGDNVSVQLWLDDEQRIFAVNLLVASP